MTNPKPPNNIQPMIIPERLQGTDGIRGRVAPDENLGERFPLAYYLEDGFLTPSFFELYAYAYGQLIQKSLSKTASRVIVVGWDSRDKTGLFNQAAVRGLLKAGLDVYGVGVLPTPAIPLYMLKINALGSMVLTASHNPADQNGIKLFHGETALKFLPVDDTDLTRQIAENAEIQLNELAESGQFSDHSATAKDFFINYHLNPKNSWIGNEPFDNTILVIDASNGAVGTVAREIFSAYSFAGLFFTNMYGEINHHCGVADIEGEIEISRNDVVMENARFSDYQTLTTLYNIARENDDVETGKIKLTALIFDGDGDRCYRLDYRPETKGLIVSSGDFLGIHQARYLMNQTEMEETTPWFVNTVESDLNTGITAEDLGYKAVLTGVGDKWILLNAVTDNILGQLELSNPEDKELHEILWDTEKKSGWSGLRISELWRAIRSRPQKPMGNTLPQFQVGVEESGHCITAGYIDNDAATDRSFAGNGVKSGLNSLVACREVFRQSSQSDWYSFIRRPFVDGVKETAYVYYVNKANLLPGTDYRAKLELFMWQEISNELQGGLTAVPKFFPEEESMVFFSILRDEKTCGAVFTRNSGTEDKSALYLRGEPQLAEDLNMIGAIIHSYLLKTLKNPDSDFVRFEKQVLQTIHMNGDLDELLSANSTLPVQRILKEIEFKEKLIYRDQGVPRLTDMGKSFIG